MSISTRYTIFAGKKRNSPLARTVFAMGVALLVLTKGIKASINGKEDHLEKIQLSAQKSQYPRDTDIQNSSFEPFKVPRIPAVRYSLHRNANKKEDTLPLEAPAVWPSTLDKKPTIPLKPEFLNKHLRTLTENTKNQESSESTKSGKDPENLENPAITSLSDTSSPKKPLRKSLKKQAPQPPSVPNPEKRKCSGYKVEGKDLAGAVPTPLVEIAKSKKNKKF